MEDVNGYIQMIDFSAYSLGTTDIDEAAVQALSENLMHSFTTSGFAYLKNTGITDEQAADFLDMFKFIGKGRNSSHLRSIRYPPVPETVKENQVRCGEHTDFGCITLLFQDNAGLEVAKGDGEFVAAPPITDTVVINIADTLQRWSADKLVSTKHRVMLPYTPETRGTTRRCVTFFTHPDFDAVMKCLDGSDKYPPVRAEDYVASRLRKMYL
uniref:Fe2OG dioxygenase domain-containing protein n=1 Tax=Branchiostoma floridae TaxID=7739 RepID=C3XTU4_BRAFL|eukprot:XP_002612309.1 hypothetical protein BRAFLDRAFT_80075 [Branchiostoma floridae]